MTARVPLRQWFAPVPMLAGVLLIVLTCALGRWQLSRAHERIDKQARIEALAARPRTVVGNMAAVAGLFEDCIELGTIPFSVLARHAFIARSLLRSLVTRGVFTEDGRRVQPGSGERGLVAVGGYIPLGYYKDEAKTAQTFRTFEGQRWSVPGDWVEVNADGTLNLLGRGSVCINTGGEKVFPEEVEEVLKRHESVRDAVVVGIPDARFGEAICAVVEASPGASPELSVLADHVKAGHAHYKVPRHLVVVDTIGRAPNGKVDYKRLKGVALERLGLTPS